MATAASPCCSPSNNVAASSMCASLVRTALVLLCFLAGDGQLFAGSSSSSSSMGVCRADFAPPPSYYQVGLIDRPSPGKVAYGVMVYQRQNKTVTDVLDQFTRLFDAIYSPEFTFVVHVDIKSDPVLINLITEYVQRFSPQASTIPSVSVSWGGVTVVERTLALMQAALERDPEWEYFVNIGQEDYPLERPEVIQDYLAHSTPPATNFIYCWDLRGHDFFGQWEHHQGRVSRVFVDLYNGKSREVEGLSRPPPKWEHLTKEGSHRVFVELYSGKSREVKGLSRPPPKEYTFYKSLQQTVLSRSFVSTAVHSAEARRLLLYLATSEAPDEIFFPTLLHLPPHAAHASRATCNGTLHFSHWIRPGGSWHPEYLTPLHLPLLLEKMRSSSSSSSGLPAFWARKFDVKKGSSALMGTLDYHRECRHVFEYEEGDMDWAPAIVFAREMEGKIGVREGWEEEGGGGEDGRCVFREVRLGGQVVTGEDMLAHLDKARRSQDAEAIMRFIVLIEGNMKAHTNHYAHPRWQEQRGKLQQHREEAERDLQPGSRFLGAGGEVGSEWVG